MAEFKYRKKRKEFNNPNKKNSNNDYTEIALTKMGKRQLTLTLVSILAVTLISIGSTFAMFTVSSKSAEYNVVKSGTLTIDFSSNSSTVGLDGALPMSDSDGLAQTGNTFTIKNTGSLPVNYTVSLQDDADMIIQDNCSDKQLDKGFIKYNIDGTNIKLLSDSIDSIIISGSLKAGESKSFTLKLWIKEDATNEALGKHYHGKIVVDAIQEGAPQLATKVVMDKANAESLDYNTATDEQKKEMWTFSHEATDQTGALTDYRYIGADPNNYVSFNDELWRIIGVFDTDDGTGKLEKRLKIIRNEALGEYSWDLDSAANYNNNWITASSNTLLNETYYNKTTGTHYNPDDSYSNAVEVNLNFTSSGLTDKSKQMIGDAKWYLGGSSDSNDITTQMFYKNERGTNVYDKNSYAWTGKVGMIYSSDYGYATSGGTTTNRASCLSNALYTWKDSSINDCMENNWLYKNEWYWTLTISTVDSGVFSGTSNGTIVAYDVFESNKIFPVVFLKSTVKIVSGSGTKSSPYILSGN